MVRTTMHCRIIHKNGRYIPQRKGWFFWHSFYYDAYAPLAEFAVADIVWFASQEAAQSFLDRFAKDNWASSPDLSGAPTIKNIVYDSTGNRCNDNICNGCGLPVHPCLPCEEVRAMIMNKEVDKKYENI